MANKEICYTKQEIVNILKDLESIVVSLDRIGSKNHEITKEEYDKISSEFLDDWDVCRKLLEARKVLSEAFSDAKGNDNMDVLERELQDVKSWSQEQRKP